jgi:histidyl-tRNA synthetase
MPQHAPRGTTDLLPNQAAALEHIRQVAQATFSRFGFALVETPSFEQLDVFVRGIGEATDVVGKEMFLTFSQHAVDKIAAGEPLKADERLALRPEGTAGVARAVVEHNLVPPGAQAAKLWYVGPMYRHERPQKGRLREFHQVGVECLGAPEPSADAEVIIMLMRFFEALGLPRAAMHLYVNSMGCDACRPAYRAQVRDFIHEHAGELCEECNRRAETNPLRAFDCKNEACQAVMAAAPRITDALCPECRAHYEQVLALLDASGIAYEQNPRLVRGLDYYTRTVFEVQVEAGLGAQNAIGGGGRYDKLLAEYGGKPTPGLGFAVGLERIQLALEACGAAPAGVTPPRVFVVAVSDAQRAAAFKIALALRDAGISAELDHQARSLKSQFKAADKIGAPLCVVAGPDELADGQVKLRNLTTHEEHLVSLDALVDTVQATTVDK